MTDLYELRGANIERAEQIYPQCKSWSLMERACELGGEAGEALNAAKKIQRDGMTNDRLEALAEELADVVICADLVAEKAGICLAGAVAKKFNKTSRKLLSDVFIEDYSTGAEDHRPGTFFRTRSEPWPAVGVVEEQVSCGSYRITYYFSDDSKAPDRILKHEEIVPITRDEFFERLHRDRSGA